MEIKIYNSEGLLKATISPDDSSTQVEEIQGDNILTLSFTHYDYIEVDVNDYVDFEGRRYWSMEQNRPTQKSRTEWRYAIKFYGIESLIKRWLVINKADGEANPVFTLTAPPHEHVAMIVASMNDGMGDSGFWTVGTVEGTGNIVVDYFGKYCDEALREIAEKTGSEYWFDGHVLNVCRCEHGEQITLGHNNGLLGIDPDYARNVKYYTRLYPIGSSRNIDSEKYGYSHLQLPDRQSYVEVNSEKYGRVDHFEKDAFAGIFPQRIGEISSVRSIEQTDGTGKKYSVFYFKDDDLPFNPDDYMLPGKVMRVSFQEGSELAGLGSEDEGSYFFETNYNSKTNEFEIITIWPYDKSTALPGGALVPNVRDKYILWNIRMPDEYYALAEKEFLEAVNRYNDENAVDVTVYKSTTDHVWIEDSCAVLSIGRRVRLESDRYFPGTGYRDSRITKITRKVNLPSRMDIEIGDAVSRSSKDKITQDVRDAKSYAQGLGEALSGLRDYLKGMTDAFTPLSASLEKLDWRDYDKSVAILANRTLVSVGDVQAFGASAVEGGPGGSAAFNLLKEWGDPYNEDTYALSAKLGEKLNTRLRAVETAGYLTSDDLNLYATRQWVENKGYLTSAALDSYAKKSDIPSLSDYATEQWVANKGYLTSAALKTLKIQRDGVDVGTYSPTVGATINLRDVASAAALNGAVTALNGKVDKKSGFSLISDVLITKLENIRNYVLPVAKAAVLGGVMIGSSLSIDAAGVLDLPEKVAAGTYSKVKVDKYGRVTSGSTLAAADIPSLSWNKITSGKPTTLAGYGITDAKISGGVITLGNVSITPLVAANMKKLTFAVGSFEAKTYTPNSAAVTVKIPTSTDHIAEGANRYFTDARAVAALKSTTDTLQANITALDNKKLDKTTFSELFEKVTDSNGTYIKAKFTLVSVGDLQAFGASATIGGGSGGSVNVLLDWANYGADKKGWALSAELGYGLKNDKADKADLAALTTRVTALEGGSALTVVTSGAGNAITSISKTGTQIIATKGATFLTQHQSLSHLLRIDGSNGTNAGVNALLNKLNTGSSVPVDDDFYLSQYSGGGTSNTTVVKRKISLLWNYIKGKADSVYLGINAKAVDSDKLDGKHLDEVRKSALAFSTFTGTSTTGGYDLNSLAPDGGIVNNYEGISCWGNAPAGAKYGFALHLTTQYSIGGQLFADINHNDVNDVTRSLWWRASGTVNSAKAWGKWHQIAFTDSTVNNAKSLGGVAADQYLTKSNYTTTLDGRYYTETEADGRFAAKISTLSFINNTNYVGANFNDIALSQKAHDTYIELWDSPGWFNLKAGKYIINGGKANQFLKADGSVDSNTYLTTLGAALKYLPLTGGTLTGLLTLQHGTDTKLIFNNTDGEKYTVISFREAGTEYSAMRAHEDRFYFNKYIKAPHFIAETTTLCSNLNADLLDGLHAGDFFRTQTYPTGSAYDLDTALANAVTHEYRWVNAPQNSIASVLDLTYSPDWRTQLFIVHTNKTEIKVRSRYNGTTWGNWRSLAFTDSNVASATKLSDNNAFTVWGQTFFENGKPKGVSGNMTIGGGYAIIGKDSKHILQDHANGNVSVNAATGNLYLGYTYTDNIHFYAGKPDGIASAKMTLLGNGNFGIGTTSPAYKLDVKGDVRASDKIYIGTSGAYLYYDAANGCIRFNKTIVSDGDVQAFGASQTSGGSGGGTAFNLLTSWGGTYDGTYALSARLGVDLNTRLRAVEAAGYLTSITKAMVENVLTGQITTHTHNMLDRPSDTRAVATKPNDYNGAFRFTGMKRCDALGVTSSDTYVNGFGWRGWSDSSGGHAWEIFGDNSSLYVRHGLNTSWDSWQKVLTSANYASVLGSIYQAKGNYALASQLTDGSVTKLGKTNVGASNLPVYLSGGVPKSVGSIGEAFLSWGGKNISGGISPIDCAASNLHSANRLAFAKPEGITVEYSRNGGSSWTDYGANDVQKIKLVSGLGQSFYIGSATSGVTTVYRLRVTLNATQMGVYTYTHKLLLNISTNGASGCKVMLERSMKGSETSFATVGTYDISGWSGWNSILYNAAFGGDSNQTTNVAAIRLTFSITGLHTNKDYNNALTLTDIVVIGSTYWATPSKMARTGHLYDYDAYQNASFPGNITLADGKSVTAPGGFIGALSGNAATATKLQTARKINGTNFDGANDITTAKWGTARNISIADYNSSHTGAGVSVDGSGNVTLKLPPTITASLSGNATTASKWATARIFMVQDYTLNNQGTQVNVDGSGAVSLMMPSAADFSKLNVSTLSAQSASVSTTLSVTGATKLSSTLSVSGGATLSSTLSVAGATTLKSTLSVTNDTTLTALNVKTVARFRHAGTAAKWIQFEPVAAGSLNIICKTDSGNSSTSFGSFNINGQLDLFKLYIDTSLILGANSRVTGNINMVTAGAKIYLDKDNDAYLYYDRANKCVRTNKTFVSDGDVQAFGASGSAGPNVTYLSISTDGTLNIPAEATDVVIYSTVDGGTVTLKLTGDTSAMTIIRLYVREYSAGDVDIKFDTDKVNVPNGRMTMLSLVKDKNGKIFLAA